MGLKAVQDAPDTQNTLDLGPPPEWEDKQIDLESILTQSLGAPPEDEFVASVVKHGVTIPILVEERSGAIVGHEVIDGRRRVAAAQRCGHTFIPARIIRNYQPELHGAVLLLAMNDPRSTNPIVELEAIEELLRHDSKLTAPQIARGVGMKLTTVKARMKLVPLMSELRDGARESKMPAKVVEAAARCNEDQQRQLIARLQANGKVTMDDIREIKKVTVSQHQRQLPGENWKARALKALKSAESEIFLNEGRCDAYEKVQAALAALEELDD